jgi:hypothetical protein
MSSHSPHASRPSTFRAPGWGTLASLSSCCRWRNATSRNWYLSAIVRLQGFSSGSPAASPRRWSPKTVTTSSGVGRSKPGCGLCPALSFKDLHHPCWGGERGAPTVGVLLLRRPSNVGGCSYLRRWNRSSVCNGTLSAGVCSLWLSEPEHVCIFGTEPCFFLIPSTRTRLSAN